MKVHNYKKTDSVKGIEEQVSTLKKRVFYFPKIKRSKRDFRMKKDEIFNRIRLISFHKPRVKMLRIGKRQILTILLLILLVPTIMLTISLLGTWIARAAATIYWDGGGDGTTWTNPLNWNTDAVPVATDDVLIDTASTVIITAPITVNSLVLGTSAGTVASVLEFKYDAISLGALTISGGDLTVYPGASITHTAGTGDTIVGKININVQTGNANIYGSINADGKGSPDGYGLGAGVSGSGGAGGASHGGYGGNGKTQLGNTTVYDSTTQPVALGSGGGVYGTTNTAGEGGGAIKLTVAGTTTVNGNISANGTMSATSNSNGGGGGSGGAVWLTSATIVGSGNITANGGNSRDESNDAGGGGGGRIALYYTSNSLTQSQLSAMGGRPLGADALAQKGGAGTIYLKAVSATNGNLIIDNKDTTWKTDRTKVAVTPLDSNLTIDNLTIDNYSNIPVTTSLTVVSTLSIDNKSFFDVTSTISANSLSIQNNATLYSQGTATITYTTLNWVGGIIVDRGGSFALLSSSGDLTVPSGSIYVADTARTFHNGTVNGTITNTANTTVETYKINLTFTGDLTISSTGSIDVTAKGYMQGVGPGKGAGGVEGPGGGGYGGTGGNGQGGALGGTTYGDCLAPINLGSGGGLRNADTAGAGGGAIKLTVSGTSTINGTIIANGGSVNSSDIGWQTSGGSGGSVWLNTGSLVGSGTISANGGVAKDGSSYDGGGGGGGRISINYTTKTFTGALEAKGGVAGSGGRDGGPGTVYTKAAGTNGDLIFDNTGTADVLDGKGYAILSISSTFDNVTVRNRSTLEISSTVVITGTLSLATNSYLRVQSAANISYATLDWGSSSTIIDNGGVMPLLANNVDLVVPAGNVYVANTARTFHNGTVNGTITNTANTNAETYKINLTFTGDLTIPSTGSIDVDGKGFTQGSGPGRGTDGSGGSGGASHGGTGGNGRTRAGSTVIYGSITQPVTLGSGGGVYKSSAGKGGGAVKLVVSGVVNVDGKITANGTKPTIIDQDIGGGGSGGSIWLVANTISGGGTIAANGGDGNNDSYPGGGGGGGRISINYTVKTFTGTLDAKGGRVNNLGTDGGPGTVYTKAAGTNGDLVFDNTGTANMLDGKGYSVISIPSTFDSITVRNRSTLEISSAVTITGALSLATDSNLRVQSAANISYATLNWDSPSTIVDNGGVMPLLANNVDLVVPAGNVYVANTARTFHNGTVNGTVTNTTNTTVETYKINLTFTGDLTIPSTGSIDVDGKGFTQGSGPGRGTDGSGGSGGASHGGTGGDGRTRAGSTVIYGSITQPVTLGSGGGVYKSSAGKGGGAVKLVVSGVVNVDGKITANGTKPTIIDQDIGGGGSGGSIWLVANTISGGGTITANGGNGNNDQYPGGGGGGGRIALYYASKSISANNVTVNGGISEYTVQPYAKPGSAGTIYLVGKPATPLTLSQFKMDGTTAIALGGSTNETSMIASFQVADANDTDTLTPEVEIQPVGTAFNNVATGTGTPVTYSGTAVLATITVNGLADNGEYHWQARVCDSTAQCSAWVSAGNNTEAQADVKVVMNTAPNSPIIPESSFYINGQYTNYVQPNIGFVLSDPNTSDTVGYQIQIDTDSEFISPIVDYISGVGAQGTQSFIVGQDAGEGSYNTGAEAQELTTADYYWRVKAIDNKGSQSGWTVAVGTPAFRIDLSRPTNAKNVRMKASVTALNEYTESADTIWFNNNGLYFKWDAGADVQGVKGYCLYLGIDSNGDPATDKGLLGTSPVSTTGSTCDFITDKTEIDFSNSALRSYEWLTSSNDKYYFKVKTIDIANNIYEGPDETNFISFNFDNTPPQNVTAVSAPSTAFSNTADMYINWPTSGNNAGSDLHSQVLGFQYAINTRDTWYGDSIDPMTGLTYTLLTVKQPLYFPQAVRKVIQLGQNTVYFRVVDKAGNFSELRTVYINFGGEAPKFADGDEVTVIPTQSSENSFGFSWPSARASSGNEISTYYYMINTPPPVSYATIASNSATYIATTQTSVEKGYIAGLRKGANTIYVVAVDKKGNYSSANVISATFYLNTELPDPPTNLIIADSSIKDVFLWRAALVWDEPVYKGTGSLTYYIQRSENATDWETVKTTTGLAYVDVVEESKRYYWRVGTVDNSDESIASPSYSNAVSIIPRGKYTVPPTLTSGPVASSLTTTKATLSWTTSRTADSKVAIGLASGNYFEWEPSVALHTTEHMIPLSNLKPGTKYFYKAKWTDEDGNTGESQEKTFITNPPPEVKEVRISNLGISSTIINFTTKNASNVKIFYGPSTSFGGVKEVATSKLETTYAAELEQLQDGTKYYYKINTFDEEGEEYEGTTLDFTTLPRPKVSNVLVQQVAKTAQSTLLVTWESNTAISSVVTFYPEKKPELMKDVVELTLVKGQHKMLVKGLFPDTAYILRVRGTDVIGNEAVSENIRIITSSDTRPPQISGMNIEGTNVLQSGGATQATASQLVVTWTTDEPATSQVEYGEGSSDTYAQLTQEDRDLSYNHVVIISGLTPAKVYHLRAISKDSASNESKSIDTVTITPKATNNAFYLVITTLQEAFNFLGNLSSNQR